MKKIDSTFFFTLYSCCIAVKGAKRSMICDIQRGSFCFIGDDVFDLLLMLEHKSVVESKEAFESYDVKIDEILEKLEEGEWGFFTNEPINFPKLDLAWKSPHLIQNMIIDIENSFNQDIVPVLNELDKINCEALQIRIFGNAVVEDIKSILELTKTSTLRTIELIVKYNDVTVDKILELPKLYFRISFILIYASNEDAIISNDPASVLMQKTDIKGPNCCGIVSPSFFVMNIRSFTEAQHHNTCLNRKISIDTEGNIKNCPSMKESYGNIRDTTLMEALEKPGFKKYWNINKDQIEVCKDCEFRYICTDCRAYIEDPENILSKPLKCGYNPYTCEWEEWSTNPLKQQAIEDYGMQELVKRTETE